MSTRSESRNPSFLNKSPKPSQAVKPWSKPYNPKPKTLLAKPRIPRKTEITEARKLAKFNMRGYGFGLRDAETITIGTQS